MILKTYYNNDPYKILVCCTECKKEKVFDIRDNFPSDGWDNYRIFNQVSYFCEEHTKIINHLNKD